MSAPGESVAAYISLLADFWEFYTVLLEQQLEACCKDCSQSSRCEGEGESVGLVSEVQELSLASTSRTGYWGGFDIINGRYRVATSLDNEYTKASNGIAIFHIVIMDPVTHVWRYPAYCILDHASCRA